MRVLSVYAIPMCTPTHLERNRARHVNREPSGEVVASDGLAVDDERGVDRAHVGCEEVERLSSRRITAGGDEMMRGNMGGQ